MVAFLRGVSGKMARLVIPRVLGCVGAPWDAPKVIHASPEDQFHGSCSSMAPVSPMSPVSPMAALGRCSSPGRSGIKMA